MPRESKFQKARKSGSSEWRWSLVLFAATFVAYLPVWRAGFIWDDDFYVTDNPTLRTLDGLRQIWFQIGAVPQYYPLVHTSFWIEYHLWGLNPLGYHLVNVFLHGLAAVLLAKLLLRLRIPGAWLAAAIFALHPVGVESVAWVTERKNVLSAVFYFASALAYFNFLDRPEADKSAGRRRRWYAAALVLFVAALLSKTVACSLPVALLLVLWWKTGWLRVRDVGPLLPFFAVGVSLGLLTAWMERHHVGAEGAAWSWTFVERCLIAGRALWFYAGKLIWPANLSFIYPLWRINLAVWWQWLFPAAAIGLVAGLWFARRRIGRGPLAAVLFFVATLGPALGFINVYPMRFSFVADHFQYTASIGLITLAAAGISTQASRLPGAQAVRLSMVVVPAALAALTWQQCTIYINQETLWRNTIARNPDCYIAHNNLGHLLSQDGNLDEALEHFRKTVELEPDDPQTYFNVGTVLIDAKQPGQAIPLFQKTLEIKPSFSEAMGSLGLALFRNGQTNEAIVYYQKALQVNPSDVRAHINLAAAYDAQGQLDEAIVQSREAVEVDPGNVRAHDNLAHLYFRTGKPDDAINELEKIVEIQPEDNKSWHALGTALLQRDRVDEAIACFQKGLGLHPEAETFDNLGSAFLLKTNFNDAITCFQMALKMNPADANAQNNIGTALLREGHVDDAIACYQKALEINPGFAMARDNLAAALRQKDQPEKTAKP